MNRDDLESRLRQRLHDAPLPLAPSRVHERVAAVTSEHHPSSERPSVAGRPRLLLPLAAVLAIAAVSVSGWGADPQPSVGPSGSTGPIGGSPGPPVAQLTVESRVGEWCHQIGGCEFHVELAGPGGPWEGKLEYAGLGNATGITPPLPDFLPTGTFQLSAEIHLFGDGIPEGATGPPDLGTIGTCASEFTVTPDTSRVHATLSFWLDRCSAGALVSDESTTLARLNVVPTFTGSCGEFGCEYRVLVTGQGGSWQTVLRTPKLPGELVAGSGLPAAMPPGSYVVKASSHRMSDEQSLGAGHRQEASVAATCSSAVQVANDRNVIEDFDATLRFADETCSVTISSKVAYVFPRPTVTADLPDPTPQATPEQRCGDYCWAFGPEYPTEPPTGGAVPIERATLSDDRRTLNVEFWAGGCLTDFVPWVGRSGDELLVGIVEVATERTLPSGAACVMIAFRYTYQLSLPEPFTGSTVRDINGGVLSLD